MINVNLSKEFEMPEYWKETVAGSQEKDLRWLEPYEGKLSSTVPRGGFGGRYLSPLNSYSYKKIFGTEKNKNILIHFLNDILGFTGANAIQEVEFLSTIMDPEIASDKQSIVDVLCRDSTGARYVIEMQLARDKGFEKRAQLYAAKAYSRQADKGGKYIDLKKVFFIAISNCNLFPDKLDYISSHTIRDEKTNEHDLKDFQFIFIELPKFPKSREEQLENVVDRWLFFFKYAEETTDEDLRKIAEKSPIIKLAYDELDKFHWNEKDLLAYEERVMDLQKEAAILEQRLDDARDEGKQEGRLEGIQIGHEKGKMKAKIAVARNLLKAGVSVDLIAESTGLSLDEIKELNNHILS